MGIFNILAVPLGYIMQFLYNFVQNYGWTIIIFTLFVRVVLFPLAVKQQKSTARMSAYNPMIQEIQKKWANDRQRQQVEVQKFQEENNIKMSVGCAPMAINMLVLFGIIAVIQSPLQYVLSVPAAEINTGVAIVQKYEEEFSIGGAGYTQQSLLIDAVKTDPERFTTEAEVPFVSDSVYVLQEGEAFKNGQIIKGDKVVHEEASMVPAAMTQESVDKILNFKFQFLGLNLAAVPTTKNWVTLIMPILSLLTMVLSQLLIMKLSPSTQGRGQMILMTVVFGVMFGFFAFRVPAGFSLYYTVSNVIMTLQQIIVRKIHDPEKIRAEVEAEIEERKKAKKTKKKVVLVDDSTGEAIDKELSESELAKLRLAKARELDEERYGLKEGGEKDSEAKEAAEKARKLDEEKYGGDDEAKAGAEDKAPDDAGAEEAPEATDDAAAGADAGADTAADQPAEGSTAPADDAEKGEYKPGRRKRARQNKESGMSFAEQEAAEEKKALSEEKEEQ